MSMLKYVFAFFAFIVVSLASVHGDEGYIPYFPDFLEPDGIGFRGPADIGIDNCWTPNSTPKTLAPRFGGGLFDNSCQRNLAVGSGYERRGGELGPPLAAEALVIPKAVFAQAP